MTAMIPRMMLPDVRFPTKGRGPPPRIHSQEEHTFLPGFDCRASRHSGVGHEGIGLSRSRRHKERMDLARKLGAEVIDYKDGSVHDQILALTRGAGPDATIDAVG